MKSGSLQRNSCFRITTACWLMLVGCGEAEYSAHTAKANAEKNTLPQGIPKNVEPSGPPQPLQPRLRVGDRFPLVKRLDQFLKQVTPHGTVLTHQSQLELWLSMTIEEVVESGPDKGQIRIGARYRRIRFSQNVPGAELQYDSDTPPTRVPLEIQGYHGLKDNGFSFWIDTDRQLLRISDFDAFIDRCVAAAPLDQRRQVRTFLARNAGADGIANFIDDSLGLLPTGVVCVGDSWNRSRQVVQPVPMHIATRYTLTEFTHDQAQVSILGTITPSTTYGPDDQQARGVEVRVKGGRSIGVCSVDRRTGLPVDSRVEQELSMHVKVADNVEFDQFKTTVTTIRIYPDNQPVPTAARDANRTK